MENKVCIITGASSGIGRATAVHFSKLGCKLVLIARNETKLDETITMCKCKTPNDILKIVGDLTDPLICQKVVEDTIKHMKKVDVLVNNAGITKLGNLQQLQMKDLDTIMNINFISVVNLTKLCAPHLITSKGAIVNISSIAGSNAYSAIMPYCVTKAALEMFSKCISLELAPHQVRVNIVSPGTIKTNISIANGKTPEQYDQYLENAVKNLEPMGRHGDPDEVARAIAFLASNEQASFVSGTNLFVDGARHLSAIK